MDTISRQAVIDLLKQMRKDGDMVPWEGKNVFARIRELPEEPHWIPVTKKLPDDLAEVNVTWINHRPEPYYLHIKDKPFTASAVYYKNKWYWYSATCVDVLAEYGRNEADEIDPAIEITAWAPMPAPWKGEVTK